jgi:hypothetical protein
MTKLSFILLAVVVNTQVCGAAQSPLDTVSFVFPEISFPAPPMRIVPISIPMPEPAPSTNVARRFENGPICGGVLEYHESSPLGLIELFGSPADFVDALASDAIEVVELKPGTDLYRTSAEYIDLVLALDPVDVASMRAVLTCDWSFDWRDVHMPESSPEFRVKFRREGRVVALDLFLSARCARLVRAEYSGAPVSFEFGYATIVEIIHRRFPHAIR